MAEKYWMWYPGDMELYYGLKQNFSRVERGIGWPAFWKSEGFRQRVVFKRDYELTRETVFHVRSRAIGYVLAGDKKYAFGSPIFAEPGRLTVIIHAACIETFPSVYVDGDVIFSDEGWMAEDYDGPLRPVGTSRYFTSPMQNPSEWEFQEKLYAPVSKENVNGGALFTFETELTAELEVRRRAVCFAGEDRAIRVYYGESRDEALDLAHCYFSSVPDETTHRTQRGAVRYAFIPGYAAGELHVRAFHRYVDIPVQAEFSCEDEQLNQIWHVAAHTFRLCSGIFVIDGIKRDRWIWSGDAYQSLFVNRYLFADPDLNRRTLLALRGNDPITTHINTITDYSMYWILSIREHYEAYADLKFVRQVYPKMVSLMRFCEEQCDENGFFAGREGDWIYVDWADIDKDGPVCAEQMLFAACLRVMAEVSALCGEDPSHYRETCEDLTEKIRTFYWDEEQSAFISSVTSGRRQVTRHANIFAILFEIATEEQRQKILESVLLNDRIPPITTPYFKFYELDVLGRMGYLSEVLSQLKSYWGGMLDRGAVTFWEEFNPEVTGSEQYDMYGDRFGKSLCHAWAASPIYLIGRYLLGVRTLTPGGGDYEVRPRPEFLGKFSATLPIGEERRISISGEGERIITREIPARKR